MNCSSNEAWESLGWKTQPNWYLDSLVAMAKTHEHTRLMGRWLKGITPSKILKTDLFKEAFGEDQLLFDLPPDADKFGIDLAFSTVCRENICMGKRIPTNLWRRITQQWTMPPACISIHWK